MRKTLFLIASLFIATSASAFTISKPIVKLETDNLSKVDYDSLDKLDRYKIFIFKRDVKEKSLVSGTGFYDKDSELVKLLHNKNYNVYGFAGFITRKNKDNTLFVGQQISYKEKVTRKTNKDGTSTTSESMGFLNDGFTINVKPDDKNININIKQENVISLKPFTSKDGEKIELLEINVWEVDSKIINENKVARFDSPVYKKDGKQYQNIYIIEKL